MDVWKACPEPDSERHVWTDLTVLLRIESRASCPHFHTYKKPKTDGRSNTKSDS